MGLSLEQSLTIHKDKSKTMLLTAALKNLGKIFMSKVVSEYNNAVILCM